MVEEIVLDTRELEAPEPIWKILDNLPNLNGTSYIKMVHRMEPKMLFTHLNKENYNYKMIQKEEIFYIYIWSQEFNEKDILGA